MEGNLTPNYTDKGRQRMLFYWLLFGRLDWGIGDLSTVSAFTAG